MESPLIYTSGGLFIEKLALIGVGLIGGSLVQALRKEKAVGSVVGVGRSKANLKRAIELGVIDKYTHDVAEAVKDADMVVLAAPISALEDIMRQMMPVLGKDTIVTDVSSVKGRVIEQAKRVMGERIDQFVPAHPIAGAEKSGVDAARASLFVDHKIIITPLADTRPDFVQMVEKMWQTTGAQTPNLDAALHDKVLGVTSHLPHVIVFALMDYLSKQADQALYYQFAAGGLYDLTRIASSDATMWRDICLSNKKELSPIVREFADTLHHMADQIDADDGESLAAVFEGAKEARGQVKDFRIKT